MELHLKCNEGFIELNIAMKQLQELWRQLVGCKVPCILGESSPIISSDHPAQIKDHSTAHLNLGIP